MSHETELKLSLTPAFVEALLHHPLLQQAEDQGSKTLFNTYFDTPDLALQRNRVALRIRRAGEQYLQTLKTQGHSLGGLHQRGEWEYPLAGPVLDLALLPEGAWPVSLEQCLEKLTPAFTTDFVRHQWRLHWRDSDIELVLDQGKVLAGERTQVISEVEMELKQGQVADLFSLAEQLAQDLPLYVCDISKGERGYCLFLQQEPRDQAVPQLESDASHEQVYEQLFGYYLNGWQRHWEIYASTGLSRHLELVRSHIRSLIDVILSFAAVIPTPDKTVAQQLSLLEARLSGMLAFRTIQGLTGLEHSPLLKQERLNSREAWQQLVDEPWVGALLLQLSAWLVLKQWRLHADAEQQAQQAASFIGS